jgi:ABC-type thiamine transport system substrate-binding protein
MTGLWTAGTPITTIDEALIFTYPYTAATTGISEYSSNTNRQTVYGCYFERDPVGGTSTTTNPRLAQARTGWVFPKEEQAYPVTEWDTFPAANTANPLPDASTLMGSDKCGNFIFDGSFPEIPRGV